MQKALRLLFTAYGNKKVYGDTSEDEDQDFDNSNDNMMIGAIIGFVILVFLVVTPQIMKRFGCLPQVQRRVRASRHADAEPINIEERQKMIDACLVSKVCNNKGATSEDALSDTVITVKTIETSDNGVGNDDDDDDRDGYPQCLEKHQPQTGNDTPLDDQSGIDDTDDTCNICLEPFTENDEITTSIVSKCSHGFHRQCITDWLMKHNECPCCRGTFIEKILDV